MSRRRVAAVMVALGAVLAAVAVLASLPGGVETAGAAQLEQIGTFSSPVSVAAPPGDPARVFVVEKGGTIQELVDGVQQPQPFLDLGSTVISSDSERGLLSMAFAPDYATSHRFYVYYTGTSPTTPDTGDIEVDQFTASSPDHVDMASRVRILTIPHHVQANHNGGQLQFGPDGMLYLGTGDGGGGGDTQGNGQNLSTSAGSNQSPLLAKILRIDPLPGGGYTVPADNPFIAPAREVWMLGLRNPWRWSFDRQTGDMIIGDVGQDAYEEIDFVPSPGPGLVGGKGENFGWNIHEGNHPFGSEPPGPNCCTGPAIEEAHSDGWEAIIGGYVVRDRGLPELDGTYVFGDYVKGALFGATLSASGASNVRDLGLAVGGLAGMGQDACGRVYMALLSGAVDRLVNDSGGYTCTAALAAGADTTPVPAVGAAKTDHTAPKLSLSFSPHQQRIAELGQFVVHAGCSEHCTITASGRLHVGPYVRSLRSTKLVVAAGARVALKLKLSHALRKLARAALRHHRHPRIAVTLRAVDQAGNVSVRRFNVAITG